MKNIIWGILIGFAIVGASLYAMSDNINFHMVVWDQYGNPLFSTGEEDVDEGQSCEAPVSQDI